jgi:hypothetical protein
MAFKSASNAGPGGIPPSCQRCPVHGHWGKVCKGSRRERLSIENPCSSHTLAVKARTACRCSCRVQCPREDCEGEAVAGEMLHAYVGGFGEGEVVCVGTMYACLNISLCTEWCVASRITATPCDAQQLQKKIGGRPGSGGSAQEELIAAMALKNEAGEQWQDEVEQGRAMGNAGAYVCDACSCMLCACTCSRDSKVSPCRLAQLAYSSRAHAPTHMHTPTCTP